MKNENKLLDILSQTLLLSAQKRPEILWLQNKYGSFMQKNQITQKTDADILIYEKMYAVLPQKASDLTKIRFWRNGQHIPVDRNQIKMFGKALDLDVSDSLYLINAYCDKSDYVFHKQDEENELYQQRIQTMHAMVEEYLIKLHPTRCIELGILSKNLDSSLRHIYYSDALKYISTGPNKLQTSANRLGSVSYGSELLRNLRLHGEIPRKTMLRHILLMSIPFINKQVFDDYLSAFGYLPLQENHTLTTGERLDYLLIQFLTLYEESCTGMDPESCINWLTEALIYIDFYMYAQKMPNLRPIYFKALSNS